MSEISQLRARVKADPSDPSFIELVHLLRGEGELDEAFATCFAGLTANPSAHRGRLALARLFYEREFWPFAAREVASLVQEFPESKSLRKLFQALAPDAVIAEAPEEVKEISETSKSRPVSTESPAGAASADTRANKQDEDEGVVAEAEFDLDDADLFGDL